MFLPRNFFFLNISGVDEESINLILSINYEVDKKSMLIGWLSVWVGLTSD